MREIMQHHSVIIVGGGQAGLSVSHYCQRQNIDHLVLEKNQIMHAWKDKRWDSFTLVTPNWQCALPGHHYDGNDPHGFMKREEIIDYLNRFADKVQAPIKEEVQVNRVSHNGNSYLVETNAGDYTADHIVIAAGSYQEPIIPRMAERIPDSIQQLHSEQYKNPEQMRGDTVLVVGSGQSGSQIAEDLHLAGKKVILACGDAPRCARFYRGKDVVDWLAEMNYYNMPVQNHPLKEAVRDNTNHYVTGRDGGRDIDLRKFALEGMELYGKLSSFDGDTLQFKPDLGTILDSADQTYNSINERIDQYIEKEKIQAPEASIYQPVWVPSLAREALDLSTSEISDVVWCIGFKPNYHWLDVPVFNGLGYPAHNRGITQFPGLYFIGLPWLHTWGSGRFSGVATDADYLTKTIAKQMENQQNLAAKAANS
jgi:putative flavoprotein involved in K+ transport